MVRNIEILTREDIKKMVKEEVSKKTYSFERLLNSLKTKVNDLDRIISLKEKRMDKKWKRN